jgi:hypothetical protein
MEESEQLRPLDIHDLRLPLVSASLTLLVKPFINLHIAVCEALVPHKPQAKQRSTPLNRR